VADFLASEHSAELAKTFYSRIDAAVGEGLVADRVDEVV
jgi:hypothetical protein